MKNVGAIICGHNRYILLDETEDNKRLCNCRNADLCPLGGVCLASNIFYEGLVHNLSDNIDRPYVGLTSTQWKDRFGVHNQGRVLRSWLRSPVKRVKKLLRPQFFGTYLNYSLN